MIYCPRCRGKLEHNMSGDAYCSECGWWSWAKKMTKAPDVITGEKLSYSRCVYEEHVKLAKKLNCHIKDLM